MAGSLKSFNERSTTTGTLANLPGNNPVQDKCYEDYFDAEIPAILSPVFVYNGSGVSPPVGTIAVPPTASITTHTPRGTCVTKGASMPSFVSLSRSRLLFLSISLDGTVKVREDVNFNETWAELEKIYEIGKAKAIGVSNFSIKTLEELFTTAKVIPAVNQIESTCATPDIGESEEYKLTREPHNHARR
ncbi:hypothetical protein DXG03_004219 [Asterophora parasitica]|uniref:NADP-dependent oxidoreductase domain-containing protein n=1 Tax=Asterophora parasitica TaxID=117018 RepID=A0A9P7KBU9_9AGAR|nr:hypothetical protein DXG03_004219 [Asterophora parasitica]